MPVTFIQSSRFGAGGYSYTNTEASDLVARMSSAPNDTRKGVIDTLVGALKTAGVWTKLDALYLFAAHDSQAALLNWKGSTYDATATNSPTFTTDRGYTGASTKYINSNFNPSTAVSPKFVQNSATLGVWSRTATVITAYAVQLGATPNAGIIPLFDDGGSDTTFAAINATSGVGITGGGDGSALFTVTRRGSGTSAAEMYRNATSLSSSGFTTSAAVVNETVRFLGRAGDWTGQAMAGFIGEQLSDTEVSDTHAALNTYRVAVGA